MAVPATFVWAPNPQVYANKHYTVANALDNTRAVPLQAASQEMQADIRERFDTKTDPEGNQWDEWSESYKAWFQPEINNIDGLMVRTGALREKASASEAMIVTNDTLFYQTEMLPSHGLAHESGLPDREHPLPQRAFLGFDDESTLKVFGLFSEWFDKSIQLWVTSTGKIAPRHAIRGGGPGGTQFASRASVGRGPIPRF